MKLPGFILAQCILAIIFIFSNVNSDSFSTSELSLNVRFFKQKIILEWSDNLACVFKRIEKQMTVAKLAFYTGINILE